MKMKSWLKYIGYIILILILIYLKEYVVTQLKIISQYTFRTNFYLLFVIMLMNVGIGILLGVEHLMNERKKDGTWKINLPKIVSMGAPLLFLHMYLLGYSSNQFVQKIFEIYPIGTLLLSAINFAPILQLIFGYVVVTSFYKRSEKNEENSII